MTDSSTSARQSLGAHAGEVPPAVGGGEAGRREEDPPAVRGNELPVSPMSYFRLGASRRPRLGSLDRTQTAAGRPMSKSLAPLAIEGTGEVLPLHVANNASADPARRG